MYTMVIFVMAATGLQQHRVPGWSDLAYCQAVAADIRSTKYLDLTVETVECQIGFTIPKAR